MFFEMHNKTESDYFGDALKHIEWRERQKRKENVEPTDALTNNDAQGQFCWFDFLTMRNV